MTSDRSRAHTAVAVGATAVVLFSPIAMAGSAVADETSTTVLSDTAQQVRTVGKKSAVNYETPGQCTWGAMNFWHEATGYYPNIPGDAKEWATTAAQQGWTVVAEPQPRSVVVLQPGVNGADQRYGHVGWVDSVEQRADGVYVIGRHVNGSAPTFAFKQQPGMVYVLAP